MSVINFPETNSHIHAIAMLARSGRRSRRITTSATFAQGNLASAHDLELAETGDQIEIGNQVWLFILFDRPAALDQSTFLKFRPGSIGDPQNADWAKPQGITLVDILDVLRLELALDGYRQPFVACR